MRQEEAIVKLYEFWKENIMNPQCGNGKTLNDDYSEKDIKCIFLSSAIVGGIITYDNDIDVTLGKMLLVTLIGIKNKNILDLINDEQKYLSYIIACNFLTGWIDWGTSIRTPWINIGKEIEISECLSNVGYEKETITLTEEFMGWFLDWLIKE